MSETAVVWLRRDLRVYDNPTLADACSADRVLPVYCFDPRRYGPRQFGGPASFEYDGIGAGRAQFEREAVADLREQLRDAGGDLLVRHGRPDEVVPDIVEHVDADRLHCQTLALPEERTREHQLRAAVPDDLAVTRHWTHTLHHVEDLPTPYDEMPDTFTPWRKAVENESHVRDPLDAPAVPPLPADTPEAGSIPDPDTLEVLGDVPDDDRMALEFAGGETAAQDRLEEYVWESDSLREYKQTRNGLVGRDYSSKFSAWLNVGCLSPRNVYQTVQAYERERVANDSTYWLRFELRWRDFFQFQFAKYGGQFFRPGGIRERTDIHWRRDEAAFQRWQEGRTGVPFVDAAMRELAATGYVSNRARQNAASFLVHDLNIDWRWGGAHYEHHLLDYDPASNYGNWAYIAKVGNDSREGGFDVLSQAERYDPGAEYITQWCPALDGLIAEYAREPWRMNDREQRDRGVVLGEDYPEPMVDPDRL
ncbi:DASH family cryptochrome [Halorhabdus sp. CBA1104]|uniref:DASH family cryptochrome n=1 Tax=Halorhabdus sp. CBA1104 TaxID=1380432 RepID=UPI0012B41675|nr:DASH family cryptochrome [Halorhabdus sp. CBA1104]QGN06108.1 DASH family cryptochrome [Halorhabdus sp. CBA1104]